MPEQHIAYFGLDQPDVLVRVDGEWFQGELRSWNQDEDGTWTAGVQWRRGPGQGNYFWTFAAEDVRPDVSDPRSTVEA